MPTLTNNECITRWADSWLYGDGPEKGVSYRGNSVRLNHDTGELIYQRLPDNGYRSRSAWGPVVLGRFIPRYRTFLLNGDGFTDGWATNEQSQLRAYLNRQMGRGGNGMAPAMPIWNLRVRRHITYRVLLIPFLALNGAEIDLETIKPIDIQADRFDQVYHHVSARLPTKSEWQITRRETRSSDDQEYQREYVAEKNGHRFIATIRAREVWRNRDGRAYSYRPWDWQTGNYTHSVYWDEPGTPRFHEASRVLGQLRFAAGTTHRMTFEGPNNRRFNRTRDDEGNRVRGYGWWEQIHHLGASLFSAVGEDGKRHKFVSAFDEQEHQMYFLAQLPDGSGANTVAEAIDALAPPVVHAARARGLDPPRQGDIFAIPTTYSDDVMYSRARTRVRREVALFEPNPVRIFRGQQEWPEIHPDEVQEQAPCPCHCGHDRTIGWGEQAQRALMIYGTAHTATEVVVWRNGATFARGVMYHDPHLEEAGRRPEHRETPLGDDPTIWHLCCRNTVPRRSSRRQRRAAGGTV